MAEKSATLIDKLPPAPKAAPKPAPVVTKPAPKVEAKPAQPAPKQEVKVAPKAETPKEEAAPAQTVVEAVAVVESGPTATGMQRVTYYTTVVDAVSWACVGLFCFGTAFKKKQDLNFKALAMYGGAVVAFGLVCFIGSKQFSDYLWGEASAPGLALRGLVWAFLAPLILLELTAMAKPLFPDQRLKYAVLGLAGGEFLLIALGGLLGGGAHTAIGLLAVLLAAGLTSLLVMAYLRSKRVIPERFKKGVAVMVFTLAVVWVLYPIIDLIGHASPQPARDLFLANLLDLVALAAATYGLWPGFAKSGSQSPFRVSGKG